MERKKALFGDSFENKERIFLFDNLKVILIIFVVFGHIINSLYPFQGIEKPSLISYVWIFIYTFHMPFFIFISGFFSKSFSVYSEKTTTIISTLIIPYVLFNFAFYLMNRNFSIPFLPDSAMWYLYALIIYRLVLPLAIKTRLIIPVSFSVSLLMNFYWFST